MLSLNTLCTQPHTRRTSLAMASINIHNECVTLKLAGVKLLLVTKGSMHFEWQRKQIHKTKKKENIGKNKHSLAHTEQRKREKEDAIVIIWLRLHIIIIQYTLVRHITSLSDSRGGLIHLS